VSWAHSRTGDGSRDDRWNHPIEVAPGRYRVVVTRGPEWSRFESVVDVTAAGVDVAAVLDHSTPTPGYDLAAALVGNGIPALAFTNAIFVDVDGGGWRGPFQPWPVPCRLFLREPSRSRMGRRITSIERGACRRPNLSDEVPLPPDAA